jgi:hypothetical protein
VVTYVRRKHVLMKTLTTGRCGHVLAHHAFAFICPYGVCSVRSVKKSSLKALLSVASIEAWLTLPLSVRHTWSTPSHLRGAAGVEVMRGTAARICERAQYKGRCAMQLMVIG